MPEHKPDEIDFETAESGSERIDLGSDPFAGLEPLLAAGNNCHPVDGVTLAPRFIIRIPDGLLADPTILETARFWLNVADGDPVKALLLRERAFEPGCHDRERWFQ